MHANQCQVVLGATSLEITREPVGNNTAEIYPKDGIVRVGPVTYNAKSQVAASDKERWNYRFPSMTIIQIELSDGNRLDIELQEVTNQSTWNNGTLAAQQQAISDINAWV